MFELSDRAHFIAMMVMNATAFAMLVALLRMNKAPLLRRAHFWLFAGSFLSGNAWMDWPGRADLHGSSFLVALLGLAPMALFVLGLRFLARSRAQRQVGVTASRG